MSKGGCHLARRKPDYVTRRRLRDQVGLIDESSEMDALCSHVKDTGGVYFVTAFSGLLAPYWDPNAGGMIVGLTQYSTASHIARATLEAVCYQSRAVLDVIEKESGVRLEELKVDGEFPMCQVDPSAQY